MCSIKIYCKCRYIVNNATNTLNTKALRPTGSCEARQKSSSLKSLVRLERIAFFYAIKKKKSISVAAEIQMLSATKITARYQDVFYETFLTSKTLQTIDFELFLAHMQRRCNLCMLTEQIRFVIRDFVKNQGFIKSNLRYSRGIASKRVRNDGVHPRGLASGQPAVKKSHSDGELLAILCQI